MSTQLSTTLETSDNVVHVGLGTVLNVHQIQTALLVTPATFGRWVPPTISVLALHAQATAHHAQALSHRTAHRV